MKRKEARLVLEDGTVFVGTAFGALVESSGEAVFNTSLSGYQEVLTDPSYRGQIVVMTYPHIGNYGINEEDHESPKPWLSGFVVRELSPVVSNWRATEDLGSWLARHGIPGIEGIDTRKLTRILRDKGAMTALLTTETADPAELLRRVKKAPALVGRDLVKEVTRGKTFEWTQGGDPAFAPDLGTKPAGDRPAHVIAVDYGAKENIFRSLVDAGFKVTVVPSNVTAAEIMSHRPDGVFLSNGPGDPSVLHHEVATVKALLGKVPVFGICLGHQLLGQAIGAKTFKLKFGHHGGNQPVKNLKSGAIEITSQNHGFAVDPDSIPAGVAKVTHINLNDMTCEGMELPDHMAFSVQYHPESAPGPHDSLYLFRQFRELVDANRGEG